MKLRRRIKIRAKLIALRIENALSDVRYEIKRAALRLKWRVDGGSNVADNGGE
jgi:hypothetical protein